MTPTPDATESDVEERGPRHASRRWGGIWAGATGLVFAIPAVAYFWLIHSYGVNTIWGDQWADVQVIHHLYSGTLSLSTLWAQHNEERNFFSNIVVVILAETSHFNVVVEMYISAALLTCSIGILIVTHRLRSRSPWILYLPVALLMFSFVQFGDTLWGFQVAWYFVLIGLATALLFLDRPVLSTPVMIGALAGAVAGSFSLLQGLFIWPVGALLMYQRRRSWKLIAIWIASGVVTAVLYFINFNFSAPGTSNGSFARHHFVVVVKFFFIAIGDVVGVPTPNNGVLILGIVIFALAVSLIVIYGLRRDELSQRPIGIALACFGLLFAASIAIGRSSFGLQAARSPLYPTMDLLILVGCYLVVLGRPPRSSTSPTRQRRAGILGIRALVVGVIGLQVVVGFAHGLTGARQWQASMKTEEVYVVNLSQASDHVVLYQISYNPQLVRRLAVIAKDRHLSLFSNSVAAHMALRHPYSVAVADFYAEKNVHGVFVSSSPKYAEVMTLVRAFPVRCASLETSQVLAVNPGPRLAPGSVHVTSLGHTSTLEVLFTTANATEDAKAPEERSWDAEAVDFVTIGPRDQWLNIPTNDYPAFLVESTAGTSRICQAGSPAS